MEKLRIALCIPTYNRSDVVEEFLDNCADYYIESGIDIFYLDSSDNDQTEQCVLAYKDNLHLFYTRVSSTMRMDEKAMMIFEGYGITKEYDFIWLCGDGVQYPKEGIKTIVSNVDRNSDIIIIDYTDFSVSFCKEKIVSAEKIFSKCAPPMILYGSTIINRSTMLDCANWKRYRELCLNPQFDLFSHVVFYWNRLLELKNCRGVHLILGDKSLRMRPSPKKVGTSYYNRLFSVWFEKWVAVIDSLPDVYKDKQNVLLKAANSLFTTRNLYRMRQDGIFSAKEVIKYGRSWNSVTNVSLVSAFFISIIPRFALDDLYDFRQNLALHRIKAFIKEHDNVYILGAGKIGQQYIKILSNKDFPFHGLCVIQHKNQDREIEGYPIYLLEDVKKQKNIGFIVAMGPNDAKHALCILSQEISGKNIFYDEIFTRDIAFSLGYRAFHR